MSSLHTQGLNALTIFAGEDPATDKALLIKVKNAQQLARSQGAIATFATALAPATIEAKVYSEMKSKLAAALKDQGVQADISIVEPTAWQGASNNHVWTDVALGATGFGVAFLLWGLFGHHIPRMLTGRK